MISTFGRHLVDDHWLSGLQRVGLIGHLDNALLGIEGLDKLQYLFCQVVASLTQVIQRHLNHDRATILLELG